MTLCIHLLFRVKNSVSGRETPSLCVYISSIETSDTTSRRLETEVGRDATGHTTSLPTLASGETNHNIGDIP